MEKNQRGETLQLVGGSLRFRAQAAGQSPPAVGAIEHKKIASPAAAARHRVIHAPFYRFLLFR
jgi:hypothetical protein